MMHSTHNRVHDVYLRAHLITCRGRGEVGGGRGRRRRGGFSHPPGIFYMQYQVHTENK
jgi:hypothetical protein